MNKPLISVLVKAFNQKETIGDCLDSVLRQTYSPLEIVIVDDHSTDNTVEIIQGRLEDYKGPHTISFIRNEVNLGIGKNFEKGVAACHGVLVFNVDGDDVCHPERVRKSVEEWQKDGSRATIVYNDCVEIDRFGRVLGQRICGHDRLPWVHGAVMAYKTAALKMLVRGSEFPPFPEDRMIHDDWIAAIRAALQGEILYVKGILMFYRIGSGNSNGYGYEFITARPKASARREASIRYMREEMKTYCLDLLSQERVSEVNAWMDEYESMSHFDILKYGGKTIKDRLIGLLNHPAGIGRWWTYTLWLRDIPLLLPRWIGYVPLRLYCYLYYQRKIWPWRGKKMEDYL